MADPENPDDASNSDPAPAENSGGGAAAGGDIGLTMSYIKSIPGILKIVEFFTLMLAFALAGSIRYYGTWGEMSFFLFVTIMSWLLVIAVFVLFALNLISKINLNINWNIPVLVFAAVVVLLLLISSALLADNARKFRHDTLSAGAAFGFISMFVFIGDAVVHFLIITGKL
ncbi:CKLF-like MARVEL transmembrane [Desmophyllum pertusum]|uniref:CKLF-like MARVEL transmembrane n=1 Tax=Desmophyllum pertusum TaxID=174260 RepID=A0A9W9YRS1_9CNID|nr:CKLF-like MARVEL transmembrane [Desmophyllum pertusum]